MLLIVAFFLIVVIGFIIKDSWDNKQNERYYDMIRQAREIDDPDLLPLNPCNPPEKPKSTLPTKNGITLSDPAKKVVFSNPDYSYEEEIELWRKKEEERKRMEEEEEERRREEAEKKRKEEEERQFFESTYLW